MRELIVLGLAIALVLALGSAIAVYVARSSGAKHASPALPAPAVSTVPVAPTFPPDTGFPPSATFDSTFPPRITVPTTPTTFPRVVPPTPVGPNPDVLKFDLARDFAAQPGTNPTDSGAWSLRESASRKHDGNYSLLPRYSATFVGDVGVSAWEGTTPTCFPLPVVAVNTTNIPKAACSAVIPPRSVFVHPDASHMVVVKWTSNFSGIMTASVRVTDLDKTGGDGVTWYIDHGTAGFVHRNIANGTTDSVAMAEQVTPGDSYFFIVDPGPSDNIVCDTTQLDIKISVATDARTGPP